MEPSKPPEKRFRFDSFATEFGAAGKNGKQDEIADNDSGIGELLASYLFLLTFFVGAR